MWSFPFKSLKEVMAFLDEMKPPDADHDDDEEGEEVEEEEDE